MDCKRVNIVFKLHLSCPVACFAVRITYYSTVAIGNVQIFLLL